MIGLAGLIIILSWVRDELSFDRFHQKKNQIIQLVVKFPQGILDPNTPYALAPNMALQYPEIASYTTLMRMESRINCSFIFNPDSIEPVKAYETAVARVDSGFFGIFDFPVLFGDKPHLFTKPDAVVISSRIANIYYPDKNPVGRSIIINNTQLLTISGVVDIPGNTFFQFDFFLPIFEDLSNDWNWSDPTYLLLKPGVDIDRFAQKITSYMNENYPHPLPGDHPLTVIPIQKTHLAFGDKWKVLLFSCVALLLVFVAVLNYMNMATANYNRRIREMGIRKLMGAGRKQLITNFFLETFILAFIALVFALFLVELSLPAMTPVFGREVEIGYMDHPLLLIALLTIVGVISSLASIYPIVLFTRGNPIDVLHHTLHPVSKRSRLILITIILQFTLSITLMISTLVVINQIRFASRADLGLSVENVVSIPMNQGIGNNFRGFLERLESYSNIEMATAGQAYPFQEDYKTNIDWAEKESGSMGLVRFSICLNDYLDLFEMQIISGRGFSDDYRSDMDKYIINESASKMLGFEDPVGQSITMWGRTGEIIGIAKDFHHVSLHREILPHIFNINPANYSNLKFIFIKLGRGDKAETIAYIESVCQELAGDFPFSYSFLEDEIGSLYKADQNLSRILGLFALLVLIVSALGIYGLAFYSVEKLAKVITIRKIFGASPGNILALFYKNMLGRISISLILAIGLSLFMMTRWLQNFAYRVDPDIMLFILPAILAFTLASIATLIAIWRSVRQNPADLLKQE